MAAKVIVHLIDQWEVDRDWNWTDFRNVILDDITVQKLARDVSAHPQNFNFKEMVRIIGLRLRRRQKRNRGSCPPGMRGRAACRA